MKTSIRISLLLLIILTVAESSYAQGRGRSNRSADRATQQTSQSDGDLARIIRDWFGNTRNLDGLPPGLAKRETLPPGLQRQLQRNGSLPPGLAKRVQSLPEDLLIRLPRFPDDRRWIYLAGNVILLDETTSTILDIIENVF